MHTVANQVGGDLVAEVTPTAQHGSFQYTGLIEDAPPLTGEDGAEFTPSFVAAEITDGIGTITVVGRGATPVLRYDPGTAPGWLTKITG
jgi:hypothetical protein